MRQPPQPNESTNLWTDSAAYEAYVGRWSRVVARAFLPWLAVEVDQRWLDIGCGSGALVHTIREYAQPREIKEIDQFPDAIRLLRETVDDLRASFDVADVQALPLETGRYDVVVSGLVLNFIPDPAAAVREMVWVAGRDATIAAYVWDYAGKMQLMSHFWNAAVALDPAVQQLVEGLRFPLCHPDALRELFQGGGLHQVMVQAIDVETTFRHFDDYWTPFLGDKVRHHGMPCP